jgi:hypothetical protein
MKPVKYGEEHKGYDDHEKDSFENCKYCRIQAVFANSSILEYLSHEKGCKRDIKEHPLVKSESTEMKTEVKTEVKVEPFKKFESRKQDGIHLITRF